MVKKIVTDQFQLGQKSVPAVKGDLPVAMDLLDTLRAHAAVCVGMAANMIGINKRIIAVHLGGVPVAMLNPVVVKRSIETYEAEEGCLSLVGTKKTVRHRSIEVEFCDLSFRKHRQSFDGFAAQIIQHELDHCEGILI